MGSQISLGLIVALLLAADAPKDGATKQDKEKIQGVWKVVSVEFGGKPDKDGEGDTWTFKGDECATKSTDGVKVPRTYKLDATKKPKSFELSGEVVNMAGIYSLEGDELKVCLGPSDKPPSEFSSKGEKHILIVLKREKR
jgi:uncharacterized protein (TIGR03067 family)